MSDEAERTEGYVVRWRGMTGEWQYHGSHSFALDGADVTSLRMASHRLLAFHDDAEIARVRRVQSRDRWTPVPNVGESLDYAVIDRHGNACTAPGFAFRVGKRIPGEPRWEVVEGE